MEFLVDAPRLGKKKGDSAAGYSAQDLRLMRAGGIVGEASREDPAPAPEAEAEPKAAPKRKPARAPKTK